MCMNQLPHFCLAVALSITLCFGVSINWPGSKSISLCNILWSTSSNLNFNKMAARPIFVCSLPIRAPMQFRGPSPNYIIRKIQNEFLLPVKTISLTRTENSYRHVTHSTCLRTADWWILETLRPKFHRINVDVGIAMNTQDWNYNRCSLFDFYVRSGKLIIPRTFAI